MNQKLFHPDFLLDSKPLAIWHYGPNPSFDILFHGAVCEETAPGTDKNQNYGVNP